MNGPQSSPQQQRGRGPLEVEKTGVTRNELGQFTRGTTSPNPGGRPAGRGFMDELHAQLAVEDGSGRTRLARIVTKALDLAESGDVRALEVVARRLAPERLLVAAGIVDAGGHDDLVTRILAARARAQRAEQPTLVIKDYTGLGAEREARRLLAPDAPQDGERDESGPGVMDADFAACDAPSAPTAQSDDEPEPVRDAREESTRRSVGPRPAERPAQREYVVGARHLERPDRPRPRTARLER